VDLRLAENFMGHDIAEPSQHGGGGLIAGRFDGQDGPGGRWQ
jgi:hypothetical protein